MRKARISEATRPTCCISTPEMEISVCVGAVIVMPMGVGNTTSWLKPRLSFRSLPAMVARKPTPWICSFFSMPSLTPLTMLASSARVVPQAARAALVSFAGAMTSPSSVCLALTISMRVRDVSPFGPLTATVRSLIATVTPLTGAMGFLPVRDILFFLWSHHLNRALEDPADYLATQVLGLRFVIGHHALGGRQERHAEAVHHRRDVLDRHVDAAAGTRDALDRPDHRRVVGIFELDLVLVEAGLGLLLGVAADEAFRLQHVQHTAAHGRGRRQHGVATTHLRIADAGQHVSDRISKAHRCLSLPASLDHAGHLPEIAELTQRYAAQLQLAVVAAGTTRDFAPVAHTARRRVARQRGELELRGETLFLADRLVHGDVFQLGALAGILLAQLLAAVVLL